MTDVCYVAVKASLHSSDSSVFGLSPEEITALSKRYPESNSQVINGLLIKVNPLKLINSLGELGYRVICTSGEAEIVWTLKREILVKHGTSQKALNIETVKSNLEHVASTATTSAAGSSKKVEKKTVKKEPKLGTNPEDYTEFYDYKGSRIYVKNPSFLEKVDEPGKIIIDTNTTSPGNPLRVGESRFPAMTDRANLYSDMDHDHSHLPPTISVHQTLDEMEFERGIWSAAISGDISKVRGHIKKGVQADSEDKSGYTALHYAARNGHGHVITTLLEAGATIDKPTRAGGATALHRAAMTGHADTCDLLLRFGANPVSKDLDGRTPLHRAVEQEQKAVVSLFVDKLPSSAFEKDNKGRSPLDYAEENENLSYLFSDIVNRKL